MCSRIALFLLCISLLSVPRSSADENASLSQLILAMAQEAARESADANEPRDDESTNDWLDGKSDDADTDDDVERKTKSRGASTADFLSRLQKPIREIQVTSFTAGARVPNDRAAAILFDSDESPIYVGAAEVTIPRPTRYTVGSWHRPLYYEQSSLERCGNGIGCLQNALSGTQFLANTFTLPYRIAQQRPDCPVSTGVDCQIVSADPR